MVLKEGLETTRRFNIVSVGAQFYQSLLPDQHTNFTNCMRAHHTACHAGLAPTLPLARNNQQAYIHATAYCSCKLPHLLPLRQTMSACQSPHLT